MSDELSLFGDDRPPVNASSPVRAPSISDRQVAMLREALDARGLVTMAERQQAIEAAAGRAVDSLRALSQEEAIKVLGSLKNSKPTSAPGNSSWDDRERNTWIDRM